MHTPGGDFFSVITSVPRYLDICKGKNAQVPSNQPHKAAPCWVWCRAGIPRFGVVCLKKLTPPKKSRCRAKNKKHPKKTQKHPQKAQKHPQKAKKTPNFFPRLRAKKKTSLFQKLIVFAGTPRRPATPGIPALRMDLLKKSSTWSPA